MKKSRTLKVIFYKAGGNSGKHSFGTRISFPKAWADDMGITPENREVKLTYSQKKIIIERKDGSGEEA